MINGQKIDDIKAELKENRQFNALAIFEQFEKDVTISLRRVAVLLLCIFAEDLGVFPKVKDDPASLILKPLLEEFARRHSQQATDTLKGLLGHKEATKQHTLFSQVLLPKNVPSFQLNSLKYSPKDALNNLDKSLVQNEVEMMDLEMSMRKPRNAKDIREMESRISTHVMLNEKNSFLGAFANQGPNHQPGILENYMNQQGLVTPQKPQYNLESPDQSGIYSRVLDLTYNQGAYHGLTPQTGGAGYVPQYQSSPPAGPTGQGQGVYNYAVTPVMADPRQSLGPRFDSLRSTNPWDNPPTQQIKDPGLSRISILPEFQ